MAGILIVEDERVVAWNLQTSLEKLGYVVAGNIASGEKAVDLAEKLKPDLILMDIRLQGSMDGIEAAARIRDRLHIPIIYLTAYADEPTLKRAMATDPYGYLIKPFKRTELHTTITTALRRSQLERQLQISEARFQDLAANLPSVIYRVLHQLDGSNRWLYISPSFQNLFETDLVSFQQGGEFIESSIYPDDVSSLEESLYNALETTLTLKWEGRIVVSSQQMKWIQVASRVTRQENGEIICDGLIEDISDRKRTELALQNQMQRQRLLAEITKQIHKSLDFNEILTTTVTQVRQILQVDRVLIFQLKSDGSGIVIQESVDPAFISTLGLQFLDRCFPSHCYDLYCRGQSQVIFDTNQEDLSGCLKNFMQQIGVKSKVVTPIIQHSEDLASVSHGEENILESSDAIIPKSQTVKLWGLLIVHTCGNHRQWQTEDVDLLHQIASNLAIALQQSELYQKLQQAKQQLERLAKIDALTHVANRRRFDEYLEQQWRRLTREQKPISLILCDIDQFKRYNDTYGHPAGDTCLVKIAREITSALQYPADLVARYGGEEFAVILPNTAQTGAEQVAVRIQEQIAQLQISHLSSDVKNYVTASLGIASMIPNENSCPSALIARADTALYQAKQQGRDRYCIVTDDRRSATNEK
ncbi:MULTISPECIES: diguanylate cyclase domain-containing protein [Nostocales]|uniref:Diguanylate cyclase n=3 Tax=Nostocales TaxID=1161 RepID=A0A8S9T3L8_9CYAN|nr:diguanylate cyclase [Tolypothrix bouteillei]KAF3886182.1 diguanylate cyclase [Tolypothrix bouteillei VB521301]